jgi:hypothetical protein
MSEPKEQNPKSVTKGERTNHVPKPPLPSPQPPRIISRRERDEKPEKALNLKQLSLRTTTLLKIEATGVLCQKDC